MTKPYKRKCTLLIGEDSGDGLDLSGLRVQFSVLKGNLQTVNVADITIYNAAPETIRRVRDEFTRVVLSAGYGGNMGVIFDGTIRWRRYGRDSATDTYLHLQAGEGDEGINYGAVSYTLDAGYAPADEYNALLTSLQPYGLVAGNKLDYAGQKAARARVLYGMVRDRLREHAATNGATWSVQGNKLQLVSLLAYLPGDAVVLTSRTGLIGMPQLTMDGVQARCLLNPSIRIDGRVQIDQKSIQDVALAPGFSEFAQLPGHLAEPHRRYPRQRVVHGHRLRESRRHHAGYSAVGVHGRELMDFTVLQHEAAEPMDAMIPFEHPYAQHSLGASDGETRASGRFAGQSSGGRR